MRAAIPLDVAEVCHMMNRRSSSEGWPGIPLEDGNSEDVSIACVPPMKMDGTWPKDSS